MTKRRIGVLVYICVVLLWGGSFAFYAHSAVLSDRQMMLLGLIGASGVAMLTYPLGLLANFVGRIAIGIGFEGVDTWFVLVTPLAALAGYWQWFHLFPRLYSGIAGRRQSMWDSAGAQHRCGLFDRIIGMKKSRAVFLYILVVLIVGLGSAGLNISLYYWSEFHTWLLQNGFYAFVTFIQNLPAIGMVGMALLTFPAGVLFPAIIGLPMLFGVVTPDEFLFLMTPFAALLGSVQWFWLLPKLYRQKPQAVADVF